MAQMLVVVSKIKSLAKVADLRAANEFFDALSEKVGAMVIESAKNCKERGAKTLKAEDLTGEGGDEDPLVQQMKELSEDE